jgi:precorrin-6B methylase 1
MLLKLLSSVVGPGAKEYMLHAGHQAIQQAECLLGTPRLLETFSSDGVLKIPRHQVTLMLKKWPFISAIRELWFCHRRSRIMQPG